MKKIKHWRYKSAHFIIAQPIFEGPFNIGTEMELEHPKNPDKKMRVLIVDHFTSILSDAPPWVSLIGYDLDEKQMLSVLKDRYPEMTLDTKVKFLFLKQL